MRYFWAIVMLLFSFANAYEKPLFQLPEHQKDVTIYLKTLLNNATFSVTIATQSFDYVPIERAIIASVKRGVVWKLFLYTNHPSPFVQKIALLYNVKVYLCPASRQNSFVYIDERLFQSNLPLEYTLFETQKGWFSPSKTSWEAPTGCESYINYK
ncbi:MAG: hypothetical protein KU37_02235 [Sulfuricurvum sp. PC08-66]|nr:MAG: hypothetical protein KU37_02235 [Sulfuricurvum sp. PC08-66]